MYEVMLICNGGADGIFVRRSTDQEMLSFLPSIVHSGDLPLIQEYLETAMAGHDMYIYHKDSEEACLLVKLIDGPLAKKGDGNGF